MDRNRLKERLWAGLVHLGISSLVAAIAAALIFLAWYPAPLAQAQGVSRLLLVLICVDVTLGPALTTLLFDRRKGRALFLDLGIVAALQLGALLYGLHAIYGGRPALIVFNVDRFDAVPASAMDPEGLRLARAQGKPSLPWLSPRIEAALIPTDIAERNALTLGAGFGGPDLPELAQYHVPYAEVAATVVAKARPLAELRHVNELDSAAWQAILSGLPLPEEKMGYLPLKAKTQDCAVIVDLATAEVLRILPLLPKWGAPRQPPPDPAQQQSTPG